MSELKNDVSKGCIRTQMNLIYAMMRLLASVLDLAIDSELVCDTLSKTAEGIFEQAAILYRDIEDYTAAITDNRQRIQPICCRISKEGDELDEAVS